MTINAAVNTNQAPALAAELEVLRTRLNNELERASQMREAYEVQCRKSDHGDEAKILGIKQKLEIAEGRVLGMKAEIAEKYRLLDEIQGREADEDRRLHAQQKIENAREELSLSQSELAKVRVEYVALGEKVRAAEWRFQHALRGLHVKR